LRVYGARGPPPRWPLPSFSQKRGTADRGAAEPQRTRRKRGETFAREGARCFVSAAPLPPRLRVNLFRPSPGWPRTDESGLCARFPLTSEAPQVKPPPMASMRDEIARSDFRPSDAATPRASGTGGCGGVAMVGDGRDDALRRHAQPAAPSHRGMR